MVEQPVREPRVKDKLPPVTSMQPPLTSDVPLEKETSMRVRLAPRVTRTKEESLV